MVREDGGATLVPVRSAGTACEVFASTVTVFRYQVDSRAKAAKAGKRPRRSRLTGREAT